MRGEKGWASNEESGSSNWKPRDAIKKGDERAYQSFPRLLRAKGLFKSLAAAGNFFLGQRCNPQASFNDAMSRFESVLSACVDKAKEAFDNAGGRTITLKVDEQTSGVTANLGGLLSIIGQVVDVET